MCDVFGAVMKWPVVEGDWLSVRLGFLVSCTWLAGFSVWLLVFYNCLKFWCQFNQPNKKIFGVSLYMLEYPLPEILHLNRSYNGFTIIYSLSDIL